MTINGIELTEGQEMTLNSAICSFLSEMQEEHALGEYEIVERIC